MELEHPLSTPHDHLKIRLLWPKMTNLTANLLQSSKTAGQSHCAQASGMQAQQAVPIVQNTTFPRAAGKRSRNDDLSQNALFQKCLQKNSK